MPQKVDSNYNMFTGPNIVRDGLSLYLDSTNSKSYPGSGNNWYDLSGNENHGTLINFTGAGAGTKSGFDTNTGLMMFDRHLGTSDSAFNNVVNIQPSESLNQCLSQNGVTIEFWLYHLQLLCLLLFLAKLPQPLRSSYHLILAWL
jgi:hypothetical protein